MRVARYVQQLYDGRTGDTFEIVVDFTGKTLTFGGATRTFRTVADLERAYVERTAALIREHDGLRDVANAPARIANLARMRTDATERAPAPHRALAALQCRDDDDEDPASSASEYVIGIDDGGSGRSKIGGDPDLPAKLAWPGNRLFVAQVDLAEVAPFDVSKWLPTSGMLYYFASEDCTDNVAVYAAARRLARREPAPAVKALADRHYRHELVERRIAFRGAVTGRPDDHAVEHLCEQLRLDLVVEDYAARMFGEPTCEPGVDVFAPVEAPEDPSDPAHWLQYDGPMRLALQLPFANGFLYLGVPPVDLKRGDLSRARATYCGT
jgi:hypothetical protein